jgi:2'-hydroxyisoflavone reductase
MQFIDVRDLGEWLVGTDATGVFNVVTAPMPMADLLVACGSARADLVWVPSERLLAAGVEPWMGVPFWIGDPEWRAANLVGASRARAAGLATRPVADTAADTLAWDAARGGPAPGTDPFPPEEEERLLRALAG